MIREPHFYTRLVALVSLCAAGVLPVGLQAHTMPDWIEAAHLCFDVMEGQSDAPLAPYDAAAAQINLGVIQETSVQIGQMLVHAAYSKNRWFLCVAKSVQKPPRNLVEKEWVESIEVAFPEHSFHRVAFHHEAQVDPALVYCRENGLLALFAFEGPDTGDFRVGVTANLPNNIESPCQEEVS